MAGSSAALGAAATGTAVAVPAQITLTGNQVSFNGNNINADITGDGIVDLPNLNVFTRFNSVTTSLNTTSYRYVFYNRVAVNSGLGSAVTSSFGGKRFGIASYFSSFVSNAAKTARISSNAPSYYYAYAGDNPGLRGATPQTATAAIPVTFSDARINSGARTNGFLTVRAFNTTSPAGLHVVQFVSLAYDDVNATIVISLENKLKKLKKKLKKAKKSGNSGKVKKFKKRIKKLLKQIRALS